MSVVGFNIRTIEASRDVDIKGKMNINTVPTIKNIKEKKINDIGKDALDIEFEYLCSYNDGQGKKPKEYGRIKITGNVLFLTNNNKKIIKDWKDKKVTAEVAVPVLNAVLRKCLTKSMELTEDLQLPPPIKIPSVRTEQAARKIA